MRPVQQNFRNPNVAAAHDVILKRHAGESVRTNPQDSHIAFTCDGFSNDFENLQDYFKQVRTMVTGFTADTDNTANFDGYFEVKEKAPDGQEKVVQRKLKKYKLPLGGGTYANSIEVPAEDFTQTLWAAMSLRFKTLKAGSYITITFTLKGWNKPTNLSPLTQNVI